MNISGKALYKWLLLLYLFLFKVYQQIEDLCVIMDHWQMHKQKGGGGKRGNLNLTGNRW